MYFRIFIFLHKIKNSLHFLALVAAAPCVHVCSHYVCACKLHLHSPPAPYTLHLHLYIALDIMTAPAPYTYIVHLHLAHAPFILHMTCTCTLHLHTAPCMIRHLHLHLHLPCLLCLVGGCELPGEVRRGRAGCTAPRSTSSAHTTRLMLPRSTLASGGAYHDGHGGARGGFP